VINMSYPYAELIPLYQRIRDLRYKLYGPLVHTSNVTHHPLFMVAAHMIREVMELTEFHDWKGEASIGLYWNFHKAVTFADDIVWLMEAAEFYISQDYVREDLELARELRTALSEFVHAIDRIEAEGRKNE